MIAVSVPPPLTVVTFFTESRPDVGWTAVVVAAGVLYASGVRRLRARGRVWRPGRSVSFAIGLTLLVVASSSGIAAYETVLFSVHATQHLLIGMFAPVFIALGAPVTLALQASGRPTQVGLRSILHSRLARLISHPLVAWFVFGGSLIVLYLTPLYEASLRSDPIHAAMHVMVFSAGALFAWAIIALDAPARVLPHPARLGLVLLAVPFHAIVGISLLSTEVVLAADWYAELGRDWGASSLSDQRTGAGILWMTGDLVGLVLGGLVLTQWMAADQRAAVRADRQLDRLPLPPEADGEP